MYNRPDDKQFKNDKKKSTPLTPKEKRDHEMDWKTKPVKKDGPKEEFQKRGEQNPHAPNKQEKYPDYKKKKTGIQPKGTPTRGPKGPNWPKDDEGGTKVPKKPAPKSPMSPAAKKLKRTASRSK